MTKYLYKACFTDYIRCQCESIFTMRELRECIFLAGIPSHPTLKIFNPPPSRSRGIPVGPTGLPQCGTPFWGSSINSFSTLNFFENFF